jgi:GTP-binding protein HflX
LFCRYETGKQAILVYIYFSQNKETEDFSELESEVSSADGKVLQVAIGSHKAPHSKHFIGE